MGSTLSNIGMIYKKRSEYDKALNYYTQSIKIFEKLGEKLGMARTFGNMGNIYKKLGDYD